MHGECYRKGNGQPYTRKKYIKGKPQIKIAKFEGGQQGEYDYSVKLLINEKIQITHMAIESTRLTANKKLEKTTGETGYFSKLRTCKAGSVYYGNARKKGTCGSG